jgi:hypothetical protein
MAAQIALPHLPTRLFRYRSLAKGDEAVTQELAAIKDNYLWCSDFTKMNDPMEGFYSPSILLKKHKDAERIMSAILDQKTSIGIACFSETKESELMWTHYAGNYGGICIAYSSQRLQKRMEASVRLVRVAYGDTMPILTAAEARDVEGAARIILSHKKMNWYYEREWRILGQKGKNVIVPGSSHLITQIYLGSRIKREHEAEIVRELHPLGIPIRKMTVSDYSHTWKVPAKPLRLIVPAGKR